MRKLFTLRSKTLAENGIETQKELWARAKDAGYNGLRIITEATFEKAGDGATYHAIMSTAVVDRHGEIVYQNFDLKSFKKNPVLLDSHNYDSIENIIGRVKNPTSKTGALEGDLQFARMNPRGVLAENLVEGGFASAVSIGFIPMEFDEKGNITKSELLELSVVSVPANPEALIGDKKGLGTKGITPTNPAGYGMAPENQEWSAPTLQDFTEQSFGDLTDAERAMIARHFAWAEVMPPEMYGQLKLPHHSPTTHDAVWRGCASAMGVCLGAMGGADIPEGDMRDVYNHLAEHYTEFGKEVPAFKAYTPEEIATIADGTYTAKVAEPEPAPVPVATPTLAEQVATALNTELAGRKQLIRHVASEIQAIAAPGARKRQVMQVLRALLNT